MGATASRSTPVVTTTRIHSYSMLLRPQTFDTIVFRDLLWNLKVYPRKDPLNELGLADNFIISVEIDYVSRSRLLDSGLHRDISIGIEIVDETGEHTVFEDGNFLPGSTPGWDYYVMLLVSRRELEASSCVRDGGFTVRCTMTTKQEAKRSLSESKELVVALDAMAGSHTLAISSFSKLKASLRHMESAYSTHFAVGGCTWYLKLCPDNSYGFTFVFLVRASKPADETPTTAKFSFEFEGLVNFESHKMTHTFHHNIDQGFFRYRLEPPSSSSAIHDDRLLIRCHLAVIPPPVTIPIQVAIPSTKSVLTPLLRAMYD